MAKESEIYNFYLRTKGGWGVISRKSMEPTLKYGWKIKIEPVIEEKIKVGDIVVFGQNNFTCHRIIGKRNFLGKTYFIHKGDNSIIGGIFEAKDLVGRVIEIIDDKGREMSGKMWPQSFSQKKKSISYLCLYLYFILYKIKRFVLGNKRNKFIRFGDKVFWKFFTRS